jgi:hypothetical protein
MAAMTPQNTMHGKPGEAQHDLNSWSPNSLLYPYPVHPQNFCTPYLVGVLKKWIEDRLWLGKWVIPYISYHIWLYSSCKEDFNDTKLCCRTSKKNSYEENSSVESGDGVPGRPNPQEIPNTSTTALCWKYHLSGTVAYYPGVQSRNLILSYSRNFIF